MSIDQVNQEAPRIVCEEEIDTEVLPDTIARCFNVEYEVNATVWTLTDAAILNCGSHDELRAALILQIPESGALIIDLKAAGTLSEEAMSVLAAFQAQCNKKRIPVRMRNVSQQVRESFRIKCFIGKTQGNLFTIIHSSPDTALSASEGTIA